MFKIYSDGATSKNGYEDSVGGWAWALIEDDVCVDHNAQALAPATNNQCELMAIIDACETFEPRLEAFDKVEVYSDSAYIINCYKQFWWKGWVTKGWLNSKREPVKNRELWERLIPYFMDARFVFNKVKGHNGDKWNEYVDGLAVKARLDYAEGN